MGEGLPTRLALVSWEVRGWSIAVLNNSLKTALEEPRRREDRTVGRPQTTDGRQQSRETDRVIRKAARGEFR